MEVHPSLRHYCLLLLLKVVRLKVVPSTRSVLTVEPPPGGVHSMEVDALAGPRPRNWSYYIDFSFPPGVPLSKIHPPGVEFSQVRPEVMEPPEAAAAAVVVVAPPPVELYLVGEFHPPWDSHSCLDSHPLTKIDPPLSETG